MSVVKDNTLLNISKQRSFMLNGKLNKKISEIFAESVFDDISMKAYLSKPAYESLLEARKTDKKLDAKLIKSIAKALKKWAIDQGATHFTHWFQPLTGRTAEKHDAFFKPDTHAVGIENLTASELLQREPDASSFPSGGLRNTAAARGYTIWDPTSPPFILEVVSGKTLYIPSVFISYKGEALGYKAPLLKSIDTLSKAATAVHQYFNDEIKEVYPTLGWEQEYFVIDADLYESRPDLIVAGRTLFGRKPAKGQELDDHYFGSIPERVQVFMHDFENAALKLGIPVLTRHNEVTPCQFECAPMFEELNISNDHNMLIMNLMEKIASKHHLKVLLHEKPYFGINGSGKHNNWSMMTDTGENLLDMGSQPAGNLRFITYFINIIKALSEHANILRAAISGPGNDHRLGACEAPPAIISVFTGSLMEQVLNDFEQKGIEKNPKISKAKTRLNIPKIPEVILDNTDRNRTSPFPFIGNRFEFRAVGSTQNCAFPMTILNTIVAHQLKQFKNEVDQFIKNGSDKESAIVSVLQNYLKKAKKIIFNGNGYTKEWEEEAMKRGLSHIKTTPYALDELISDEAIQVFEQNGILSKKELKARYNVLQDIYVNKITIEARLIKEMAQTQIIPAAIEYQNKLMNAYKGFEHLKMTDACDEVKNQIEEIQNHITHIRDHITKMGKEVDKVDHDANPSDNAKHIVDHVIPYFSIIREHADELEVLIDTHLWPFPKYRELLFIK